MFSLGFDGVILKSKTCSFARLIRAGVVMGLLSALAACASGAIRFEPEPLPALPSVAVDWSRGLSSSEKVFPFVDSDGIWIGLRSGDVALVDAKTGKTLQTVLVKASLGTEKRPVLSAVKQGDHLFVLDVEGRLFVLKKEYDQWQLIWEKDLKSAISNPLFVSSDRVLIRCDDGRLLAFDWSGESVWQQAPTPTALLLKASSQLIQDENDVLETMVGGVVRRLELKTGQVRWEKMFSQPKGTNEVERLTDFVGTPALTSKGLVCLAAFQGRAGCFDAKTMAPYWDIEFSAPLGLLYWQDMVFLLNEIGVLSARKVTTGQDVWQQKQLRYRLIASWAITDQAVVLVDKEGVIYTLNTKTGEVEKTLKSQEQSRLFSLDNQAVLVISKNAISRIIP